MNNNNLKQTQIFVKAPLRGAFTKIWVCFFSSQPQGTKAQIQTAIAYLNDLDIEIWEDDHDSNTAL